MHLSRILCFATITLTLSTAAGCGKREASRNDAEPSLKTSIPTSSASTTSAEGGFAGSCLEDTQCTEYLEKSSFNASKCRTINNGTFSNDRCPRENLLGVCERGKNAKFVYYGTGIRPEHAKEGCVQTLMGETGKFTEEPNADALARERALPPPGRIKARCMSNAGDQCVDHINSDPMNKSTCERLKNIFTEGERCPEADVLATCASRAGARRYYSSAKSRLAAFEKDCEGGLTRGYWLPAKAGAAAKKAPK